MPFSPPAVAFSLAHSAPATLNSLFSLEPIIHHCTRCPLFPGPCSSKYSHGGSLTSFMSPLKVQLLERPSLTMVYQKAPTTLTSVHPPAITPHPLSPSLLNVHAEGEGDCFLCSLLCPEHFRHHLAHSRNLIHTVWVGELMNQFKTRVIKHFFSGNIGDFMR